MGSTKLPKLTRPFAGVYRIKEVVDATKGVYRLDLPSGHKLTSDSFNVDQLEPYSNQQGSVSKIIPVDHDPNKDYTIDRYILRDWNTLPPSYYVRWTGQWGKDQETVIQETDLSDGPKQILQYERLDGAIPELGLSNATPSRLRKIADYKKKYYRQKVPLLQDTWFGSHPAHTWQRTQRHMTRSSRAQVPRPPTDVRHLDQVPCLYKFPTGWTYGLLRRNSTTGQYQATYTDGQCIEYSPPTALRLAQAVFRALAH